MKIMKRHYITKIIFWTGILLLLITSNACNTNKGGGGENPDDKDPPPSGICNNFKKDIGEEGVDCGGVCDPCHAVKVDHELLIRHLEVVDSEEAKSGDLSFGQIMSRLTPTNTNTKDFVISLFRSWETLQQSNGIDISPRQGVKEALLDQWKINDGQSPSTSDSDWNMQLENAPLRLLAITNRIDLQNMDDNSAGEGRLTFGLTHEASDPILNDFTLIFECELRAGAPENVIGWAKRWHELSNLEKDSPEYMESLKKLVVLFTSSAGKLNQIRTNEVIGGLANDSFLWEMREFNIVGNKFVEVSRKQSPNTSLNNTSKLAEFIQSHQTKILEGDISFANEFDGTKFMAGNALYDGDFKWKAPGLGDDSEALFKLTAMSCVGCHGGLAPETNFTHIKPRLAGNISQISPFLSLDIQTRKESMTNLLEMANPVVPVEFSSMTVGEGNVNISEVKELLMKMKGMKRVH